MLAAQHSEADILKRISVARGASEPEAGPTEAPEVIDVSEDEAPDEAIEEAKAEPVAEAEELEQPEGEPAPASDEDEELYVEYKGREINLKEVEEWEQGYQRQSDYTQKTQAAAEEMKTAKAQQQENADLKAQLISMKSEMEAVISESVLTPEAIAEMREYEPEEYIKYQEKITQREKTLAKAKDLKPETNVDIETERSKLWDANPSWLEGGKQTKAFTDDMSLIDDYAKSNGWSGDEMQGIQHSHHWQTLLDAAKYRKISKQNSAIEKKVRKAPVTTKPRALGSANLQTKIEQATARLKKSGNMADAQALKKLKRQLNNGKSK